MTATSQEVVADREPASAVKVEIPRTANERFLPGTVLAGRFRIFGLIGKGGMGEVYRADDLKLGQPVALKCLPEGLRDESMLERFYNEVRVARQVSHPNVCRVHDIFDWEGHHFLSMEFVEGEDLASLLRRIGRLPKDKALDIARQLCASLAAAHAKGVLHRDFKPSNIMIDGRGQVRITDFGLAGLAEEFAGREIRAGTPAYMSPEQISGTGVSVKSDIYSLGLVLYELFTGKRAFKSDSLAGIKKMHLSATPTSPSNLLDDFDPVIESVILRCLEKDPTQRPASAMAVAAALPGGDPLAAALAAGETPSPEMVAASGDSGALRPAVGIACLVCIASGIIGLTLLQPRVLLHHWAKPTKPAVVLADSARNILATLGYAEPFESVGGYSRSASYMGHIARSSDAPDRWEALRIGQPDVSVYWYRESSTPFLPMRSWASVTFLDPPNLQTGMARMVLDSKGRLSYLHAVPAFAPETEGDTPEPPDWTTVFTAAGLDLAAFSLATPEFAPPVHCDSFQAWKGFYPDNPELSLRVHAGARAGRIAYFDLIGPWRQPFTPTPPTFGAVDITRNALQFSVLLGSVFFARRNLRLRRGDRRGALRLATFLGVLHMFVWLCSVHHGSTPAREWWLINSSIGRCLWVGVFAWLLYLAIEPHVRRIQPRTIISWTRLLSGRLRDPVIGRDILVGTCVAVAMTLSQYAHWLASGWLGLPPPRPMAPTMSAFNGAVPFFATIVQRITDAVYLPMIFVMMLILLRVLLRLRWLSMVVFFSLFVVLYPAPSESTLWYVNIGFGTIFALLVISLLSRFGVLALMFAMLLNGLLISSPLTFDFSLWYGWSSGALMVMIGGLCGYGFYTSLAGQPVFKGALIEA